MGSDLGDRTEEGRRALEGARWAAAREASSPSSREGDARGAGRARARALVPGRGGRGAAARERAVEGYAHTDRCDEAARLAVWVSHQHSIAGARLGRARMARARRAGRRPRRLCAGQAGSPPSARHAATVEESAEHARRALEIARQTDADDLEVFAVSVLGRAEVSVGRIDEGMRLLEEAMAAALRGPRPQRPHACRGVLQPDRGLHERGRLGARHRVVRARRRVRARARRRRLRVVPNDPRRRPSGNGSLGRRGARPADRPRRARPLRHPAGGADGRSHGRAARARTGSRRPSCSSSGGRSIRSPPGARPPAPLPRAVPRPAAALLERGLLAAEGDALKTAQLLAALVDARIAEGEIGAAEAASRRLTELADESGIPVVTARAGSRPPARTPRRSVRMRPPRPLAAHLRTSAR